MGFRFQKRITIFPGVRINLSKTGVSTSIGGKGATVNVGTQGQKTVTLGIPGTGLSYKASLSGAIILLIVAAVVLFGLAWLIFPDTVRGILHWWQPRWF
jgi:hypothetical protein